jgi:hypothetical protein
VSEEEEIGLRVEVKFRIHVLSKVYLFNVMRWVSGVAIESGKLKGRQRVHKHECSNHYKTGKVDQ